MVFKDLFKKKSKMENINQIFDENKETHENQIHPVSETEIQEIQMIIT